MKKKVKVFLQATVNYTNAQNLNCLALAKHLDKSKYDVRTCVGYSGNLPVEEILGVRYYKVRYPARIWLPICWIFGILWSDIAYLPKAEYWRLCAWILRVFHKRAFQTVEGMFIGTNLEKGVALTGSKKKLRESLTYTGNAYSITECMKSVNERALGVKTNDKVLCLGAETIQFENNVCREKLMDIAIIGGNLFYKGLDDFFQIALQFPQLKFHVIGSGMGKVNPENEVKRLGLKNVICHGMISHVELAELLQSIQLHVFPSRAEGFPKVTLECAAAGVPSIVYDDYGADEWITTGQDGFVVKTLDDMESVIRDFVNHPERISALSDNARKLAKCFDWSVVVKDWERVIDQLGKGK